MSTEEIFGGLNKKTRDRMRMASEITIEKLPLASLGLTADLKGGLARGRVATIWGTKSASKSSLLLQTAGDLQKQGYSTAWVDAEHSYDPKWSDALRIDNSQMIVSESNSIEAVTSDIIGLIGAGIDFIVVDSISALIPSAYYEKDDQEEMKEGLGGTKQIGTLSKELGHLLQKINGLKENKSVVVFISQARNKITAVGAIPQAQGGNSIMYFSSVVIKLNSSASDKNQIKGEKVFGDKILEVPVGRPVEYTIQYSKTSPPGLTGSFDFYYEGDLIGVDQIGEIADLAVKNGYLRKSASWFYYGERTMQGRPAVVRWLKEDQESREELIRKINRV